MTAIQTVPAGVARILAKRAQEECATHHLLGDDEWLTERGSLSAEASHAETAARRWLDGLAAMALVPMEGEL